MAVHVAARVVALAEPTEVLVTSALSKLAAGAELEFIDRGMHELKGVPNRWRLFSVIDHTAAAPLA
jgi:class 3 adenylate cyclase